MSKSEDAGERPEIEASEFFADKELYACPECLVMFAFAGSGSEECPVCGRAGELDTIKL